MPAAALSPCPPWLPLHWLSIWPSSPTPGRMGWCSRPRRVGYLRRSNFRRRWWLRATHAAGVEGLRFHDLRHSAATLALAAGANTRELMERMGHTSPQVALRYQHVMAGRDQAIAAAWTSWSKPPPTSRRSVRLSRLVARWWHETGARGMATRAGRRGRAVDLRCCWSGRPDLNRRPPAPKAGALTKLRHVPLSWPLSCEDATFRACGGQAQRLLRICLLEPRRGNGSAQRRRPPARSSGISVRATSHPAPSRPTLRPSTGSTRTWRRRPGACLSRRSARTSRPG
jgi:hypothetical protein